MTYGRFNFKQFILKMSSQNGRRYTHSAQVHADNRKKKALAGLIKGNAIYIVLFIYAIIAALILVFFNGSGDNGDSISHYLFAKFAPLHPQLFFNHWAKPVYVLLACPFAQFGFIGVKLFNVIVSLLTIYITYRIAQKLNLKNSIIVTVILIFSPLSFVLTFSGLTEPLFALFIAISLYALLENKYIVACLIVSFLPFVRSEGLIIIGVYGLYFLLKRKWKLIPLLLVGHMAYSIAGFFVYNDLFWVFNKIPYAHLSSIYGSGKLFHFFRQLLYVVGVPVYILFWIGTISIMWKSVKKILTLELQILVFLGFFTFFIAHSLFWYFGIFNSIGIKRVLVSVGPLISIISLTGFNFITEEAFKNKIIPKFITQGLIVAYILIFPFTFNPAAINWERDLSLSKDQRSAIQVVHFINQQIGYDHRFVFAHPYLSEALKIDHFDENQRLELTNDVMYQIKSGDIIIWENWFALSGQGVKKEYLDNNPELINLYNSSVKDKGREILYSVYKRK
jgi:hypothetical protein